MKGERKLRPSRANAPGSASMLGATFPFLALVLIGLGFPLFGGGYWGVIATRACVYWVLVSGLNLVVGFAGQIAIGWVALLTLGAYTTSVLAAGNATPALSPYLALTIAAAVGAVFGLIIGLPALRLRTFYFAITTLGFATIVTQVALAWQSVTGGGVGVPGPIFPEPFSSQWGFYYFCFGLATICTWMTANVAASRFGRALTAIRDAEVAAEASGISKPALLVPVFLFSGAVAAIGGGLFASLQSYITPDAFTLDLSVLFFIAILIGGRGSILGPLLGTILLTVLPELAAPLVAWSTSAHAICRGGGDHAVERQCGLSLAHHQHARQYGLGCADCRSDHARLRSDKSVAGEARILGESLPEQFPQRLLRPGRKTSRTHHRLRRPSEERQDRHERHAFVVDSARL